MVELAPTSPSKTHFGSSENLVEQIAHRSFSIGHHSLDIKTTHLTTGTYFVRMGTNQGLQTLQLMVIH